MLLQCLGLVITPLYRRSIRLQPITHLQHNPAVSRLVNVAIGKKSRHTIALYTFTSRSEKLFARRAVYRAVNPSPAQHYLVRRVDDGINRQRRDVALDDFDFHALSLS